jgi:hypothetical protein
MAQVIKQRTYMPINIGVLDTPLAGLAWLKKQRPFKRTSGVITMAEFVQRSNVLVLMTSSMNRSE